MADRTVAVRLLAKVDGYKRDMLDAANTTRKFGTDAASHFKSVSQQLSNVQTESMVVGGALLAMTGAAVLASARFDKSMSKVQATAGATSTEMDRLRKAALDAGQATVFSASEAADAEAELAKAGVKTADILGGALRGSLDLAAAGGLNLADSATIAAQAMNIFGLGGRDVSHIADVLAAGANKSAADVGQLGDALRQGGLVAKQTGLDLEDTVGVLAAFADNALIGSDAGTSLKTMLQRLTPQSKEAADKMAELGVSAYDANGQFVGLAGFAGNLQGAFKDLTPEARNAALGIIFGSDAVRGANVLIDEGEQGIRDYIKAVNDQGAASRMAGTMLDNLAGDYEQLTGSIETSFIKSGSGANGVLRDMTQAATAAVNFIGDLPGPILAAGAAAAVAGGLFFIAAPRVVAFNAALAESPALARTASAALATFAPAAAVAAIATLALDMKSYNDEVDALDQRFQDLYRTLDKGFTAAGYDQLRTDMLDLQKQLSDPGWIKDVENGLQALWNNRPSNPIFFRNANDTNNLPTGFERQNSMLDEATRRWASYTAKLGEVKYAVGVDTPRAMDLMEKAGVGVNTTTAEATKMVEDYVAASRTGSVASQRAAGALDTLNDSTSSAADQLKAYKDAWDAVIGGLLGLSNAKIAAEKALDDLSAALKTNGNNWDINTEAGRNNMSAFNDVIASAEAVAQKKLEEGGSVDEANAAYKTYLDRLSKAPGATAAQRAAIQDLIKNGFDKLPTDPKVTVTVETQAALTAIDTLSKKVASFSWGSLWGGTAVPAPSRRGQSANGRPGQNDATGGWVYGSGGPMSDFVNLNASPGEFVVNAKQADQYGGLLQSINDGRGIPQTYSSPAMIAAPTAPAAVVLSGDGIPIVLQIGDDQIVSAVLRTQRRENRVIIGGA